MHERDIRCNNYFSALTPLGAPSVFVDIGRETLYKFPIDNLGVCAVP
jgi:hypothetical protein